MPHFPLSPSRERAAAVQEQIRVFSDLDRKGGTPTYILNRDHTEYIRKLHGLQHFFDHLRTLTAYTGTTPIICDIGTGMGVGVRGLKEQPIAAGIDFIGTNLTDTHKATTESNIGKGKLYITSAEELRLGERTAESVHGFLGVYSIAESADLPTIAQNLDYYLAPGGAIKVLVYPDKNGKSELVQTFEHMGYSVAVTIPKFRKLRRLVGDEQPNVVLAIKSNPNNPNTPTAQALMEKDAYELANNDMYSVW